MGNRRVTFFDARLESFLFVDVISTALSESKDRRRETQEREPEAVRIIEREIAG